MDTRTITNLVSLDHRRGDAVTFAFVDGSVDTTVEIERGPALTDGHYRMVCAHGTVWWTGDDVWWWPRPSAKKSGLRVRPPGHPGWSCS